MYAIIKHGQVLATGMLEGMFISNIFPLSDTPEWKEQHDVYEVVFPQYNPETHQLVQAAPVISGRTVILHSVVEKPAPVESQPETVETITLSETPGNSDQSADSVQP